MKSAERNVLKQKLQCSTRRSEDMKALKTLANHYVPNAIARRSELTNVNSLSVHVSLSKKAVHYFNHQYLTAKNRTGEIIYKLV